MSLYWSRAVMLSNWYKRCK